MGIERTSNTRTKRVMGAKTMTDIHKRIDEIMGKYGAGKMFLVPTGSEELANGIIEAIYIIQELQAQVVEREETIAEIREENADLECEKELLQRELYKRGVL